MSEEEDASSEEESSGDPRQDFIDRINKQYKGEIAHLGGTFPHVRRFRSGALSLDLALGGGWPFGRICLLAGEWSTGKTLLTLRAMAQIQEYDHDTHLHFSQIPAGQDFTPGSALFVDMEGSFDAAWAIDNGVDLTQHVVTRPEYAEQAGDIITAAIQDNTFDLIILDSIAAMTPSKELEASMEEWQMGLGARLCNKCFRTWTSSMNAAGAKAPTLLCLNQFRVDLGVKFGDPRTMPHGKMQTFASSVTIFMKTAKISDDPAVGDSAIVEISGVTNKNKTYVPKLNFSFKMGLKDGDEYLKGEIDNITQLMKAVKRCGLMVAVKTKTVLLGEEFKTQKQIKEKLEKDEDYRTLIWTAVVNATLGADDKDAVMLGGDDDASE